MQKTDVTCELVEELQLKTKEFLQPNPTARAKMAAVKGISKLSGQAKASTYPQPEGVLGDCMLMYGKKMGEDSVFGRTKNPRSPGSPDSPTKKLDKEFRRLIIFYYRKKTLTIIFYLFAGIALIEMGEAMRQMADVKYSLDDNIKQNFLEPLHHLQTKDLKEVMVRLPEFIYWKSSILLSRDIFQHKIDPTLSNVFSLVLLAASSKETSRPKTRL